MPLINGGNGLFLRIFIFVSGGVALAGALGGVVMYSEVAVLKADTQLGRRVSNLETLIESINADRHQRTVIIQGFRQDIEELKKRLDRIENRR